MGAAVSGDGGKGSARRPGEIKPGQWERIFGKPGECTRCGGAHALSQCKRPLVAPANDQTNEGK